MAGMNPNDARLQALGVADYSALDRKEMIPGVLYRGLLANADGTWIAQNDQFLEAIARLWEKVKGTGFITDYQIARCQAFNRSGVLCIPSTVTSIKNMDAGRPFDRLEPQTLGNPAAREAWGKVVMAFKNATTLYFKNRFADGMAELKASEANVALWDSVYTAVKTVAELPQTVVKAVGSGIGSFLKANYLFVGAIVVGAGVVFLGPGVLARIAAKTVSKVV